ncbi:MAG TPA: carboxypeptidase regulatory-like domain-containing protein [Gemmatimonadaceae bacterium]|nr:carboxypeptidase regulatory-like domain-containing protein [Gemmatimonadaceae bacterium]
MMIRHGGVPTRPPHTRTTRRFAALAAAALLGAALAIVPLHRAHAQPATVRGVVRASPAQPLPLAEVLVNDSLATRTDSAGRFVLVGLAADTVELTVRRVGFLPLSIPLVLSAGQRRNLAIELAPLPYALDPVVVSTSRPGLFGQVVDDAGRPLAGAEVMVVGAAKPVATADDGGFALMGLEGRTYLVLVRHEGHYAARFSITLPPDHGQEVHVELEALPASLTGGARRLAAGRGTLDMVRLRDLDRRMRVNRPFMVPREVLAKGGKRDIADVLARDRLTPIPAAAQATHIPQPTGAADHLPAPSAAMEVLDRMRLADGGSGACYFIDGDFARDQYMARTMAATWLESVEISRRDDTGSLSRRLPPGMVGADCRLFVVLWTRR